MSKAKEAPAHKRIAAPIRTYTFGKTAAGRKPLDREVHVDLHTRVPVALRDYLKSLVMARLPDDRMHRSMLAIYSDALGRFLDEKPWQGGLPWREPKAVSEEWTQLNIRIPASLAEACLEEAMRQGDRSIASFCYTAIRWWAEYVCPPASLTGRDE